MLWSETETILNLNVRVGRRRDVPEGHILSSRKSFLSKNNNNDSKDQVTKSLTRGGGDVLLSSNTTSALSHLTGMKIDKIYDPVTDIKIKKFFSN